MPSVGRFLELLDAVSRRDPASVAAIVKAVAEEERKRRHYTAAYELTTAAEVAVSGSGYDHQAMLAYTGSAPPPPLDTLQRLDDVTVKVPVLFGELERDVTDFIEEWRAESRLRAAGVAPRQALLMHGPPGCGKTLIAQHLAFVLRLPLFVVRFDALISSYLGETASNLQKIFEYIASNRCALLIDEIDAIAKLRDDRNELGELKRVVISLLQNLDHTTSKSLIIATTNHPHLLDPALWRRFDAVWEVKLPDLNTRRALLERVTPDSGSALEVVAEVTEDLSGSDLQRLVDDAHRCHVLKPTIEFQQCLLLSAINVLRREKGRINEAQSKLSRLALYLHGHGGQKYSYTQLAELSGIPRSTLHNRARLEGANGQRREATSSDH